MIRPLTGISVLLACGSGLYLYQTKHHAQVVDRQIEHTVQAITATRMQTRELAAAWTLLGNPDRLQLLANQYLDIKPVQPGQFVALSDLDNRLPSPRALPPPASVALDEGGSGTLPIASAASATPPDGVGSPTPGPSTPAQSGTGLRAVAAAGGPSASPVASPTASPAPLSASVAPSGKASGPGAGAVAASVLATGTAKTPAAVAARPTDRQPAEVSRPPHEVAQTHPTPPRPLSSQPVVAELERPATPAPQRVAPTSQGGSLLGMAHVAVPAPVPLSVNTAPFSSNAN
jgi:hypothetical protein